MVFNFKKSLKIGKQGEDLFHEKTQGIFSRTDGFKGDFIDPDGHKIELKSDYYSMAKTPNFFFERYSYATVVGGPWQALTHECDYYFYWFPNEEHLFIFKVADLVKELEVITKGMTLISVPNEKHITRGYKIRRDSLKSLLFSGTIAEFITGA